MIVLLLLLSDYLIIYGKLHYGIRISGCYNTVQEDIEDIQVCSGSLEINKVTPVIDIQVKCFFFHNLCSILCIYM